MLLQMETENSSGLILAAMGRAQRNFDHSELKKRKSIGQPRPEPMIEDRRDMKKFLLSMTPEQSIQAAKQQEDLLMSSMCLRGQ